MCEAGKHTNPKPICDIDRFATVKNRIQEQLNLQRQTSSPRYFGSPFPTFGEIRPSILLNKVAEFISTTSKGNGDI